MGKVWKNRLILFIIMGGSLVIDTSKPSEGKILPATGLYYTDSQNEVDKEPDSADSEGEKGGGYVIVAEDEGFDGNEGIGGDEGYGEDEGSGGERGPRDEGLGGDEGYGGDEGFGGDEGYGGEEFQNR